MSGRPEVFPDPNAFDPEKLPEAPKNVKRTMIGRNDPCPCGSGKKFKRCHLGKVPAGKKMIRVQVG